MSRADADDLVNDLVGEKVPPLCTPCGEIPGAHPPIVRPVIQFIADHIQSPAVEVQLLQAVDPILADRVELARHLGNCLELIANAAQNPQLLSLTAVSETFDPAVAALRRSVAVSKMEEGK